MGSIENPKLCDFTSHNNSEFICTPIAPPATSSPSYEIKPALLNLVMKDQFSRDGEDATLHLNNFVELCDMQKYKEVDGDIVKVKLFPFSLRGRAKEWLPSLPMNNIDSWDKCKDAFIGKYYPPAKIIQLRSNIMNFRKLDNEHVAQAWERMKTLVKNCPTHGLTTWMVIQTFYAGLNFTSQNLLDSAVGGTFMSTTLGAATKLLDEMMLNYSKWHTERAPTGKKVNSVEYISSLNEKVDLIMSLLTKQPSIDPQDVPLNSLYAQEQVDVNFVSRNNFNNNAFRSNFGSNNPMPFPSNNYGNGNSNSYSQNYRERNLPSYEKLVEIEKSTKSYMHTQFEQNKAFSRQLDEHPSILKNISKQLESLNSDISSLQTRLTAIETYVSNMSHTQSTLINQMAAKPKGNSKGEKRNKSPPTYHTVATIQVVEDVQTVSTHHTP